MPTFHKYLLHTITFISLASFFVAHAQSSWTFAVSGDSRNCGDIIMPSIAEGVKADHASFYWHLGDFRAIYDFDQDMLASHHGKLGVQEYQGSAWQDFIDQQMAGFGDTPVFLAIGNHELVSATRADFLVQFADWFDSPAIRSQRLADNASNHKVHSYYHWHEHNVDFITLDNASPEELDKEQIAWFKKVLQLDAADAGIRTVVVGMHDALPDSFSAGHSMNESPAGTLTGRQTYGDLLAFKKTTGKEVQVLASHSHFLMSDVYNTACHKPDEVLPGWIVGTAGAVRYRLPAEHAGAAVAQTDIYGYLLGTVTPEGDVTFAFHPVLRSTVSAATTSRYGSDTVAMCFTGNKSNFIRSGPDCWR